MFIYYHYYTLSPTTRIFTTVFVAWTIDGDVCISHSRPLWRESGTRIDMYVCTIIVSVFYVCVCVCCVGNEYVLASFHGDTNGLASVPVLNATHEYVSNRKKAGFASKLIFGLDANTHAKTTAKTQGDYFIII